ncbi:MAG: stress response translation initiation inhibitor YciH [Candidatus Norongarragalinales archaeon]
MAEICAKCGLPKEICACQAIEKDTTQRIRVYSRRERFKKFVTIVEGLHGDELERAAKELKRLLACGGTTKDGVIVLQGDHTQKTIDYLAKLGYPRELISAG